MVEQNMNNPGDFLRDVFVFRARNVNNLVHEYHVKAVQGFEHAFYLYGTFVAR